MRVGYIRVSTQEQNTERQKMILEKFKIEKIFEEKISGKNTQRKKLEENVIMSFWEKPDEAHTVVRLATSWSTTEEELKELLDIM